MASDRFAWILVPLFVTVLIACGRDASSVQISTATPASGAPAPTVTPTANGTAVPAWWEKQEPQSAGTLTAPLSRVWNVVVEAMNVNEVTVAFNYHLDIAPEANVFVHRGFLPDANVVLLDGEGRAIEGSVGELSPTEFGDDTVGGQAVFRIRTGRFADVKLVHICIRVVTGNYDDFAGRSKVFCEPVTPKKVGS